ncbi:MAG: BMP family ABC transporter substrate-binding protein [Clostridiales bacterium]|nr:BMP family ABC transporter substrate-binding protein [Clostridiales bacterium]
MKKMPAILIVVFFIVCGCMPAPSEQPLPDTPLPMPTEAPISQYLCFIAANESEFEQYLYHGMLAFCGMHELRHGYYHEPIPMDAVHAAASDGATVIVAGGLWFEDVFQYAQGLYPHIQFLLMDAEPYTFELPFHITQNTHAVLFWEEQAGFLAGYAAVQTGYTQLGFLGGMAVPDVVRYGYGFVMGADAAAVELGITADVSIRYWYAGSFQPNDATEARMAEWYATGTELVFCCGLDIYDSCLAAADVTGGRIIGVMGTEFVRAANGISAVGNAILHTPQALIQALTTLMQNDWRWPETHAGKTAVLGVVEGAVALAVTEDGWRWRDITAEAYDALLSKLASGELHVDYNDCGHFATIHVDYQD